MRAKSSTVFMTVITGILASMVIPGIHAAVPGDTPRIIPFATYADITVPNGSLSNHSIPSGYQATPTLLKVQVELSRTAFPAPKGEMAAGPWAIGFSADPVSIMIVILAIAAVAAGIAYVLKRKRDEEEQERII